MFLAGGTLVGLNVQLVWSFTFMSLELSLTITIIILLSRIFSKLVTYFLFILMLVTSNFIEFIILRGSSIFGFLMTTIPSYKYYSYLELVVDNQFAQIWSYTIVFVFVYNFLHPEQYYL